MRQINQNARMIVFKSVGFLSQGLKWIYVKNGRSG